MHAKNFLFTYSRSIDTLQMTLDFAVHFCLRIKLSRFSSENGASMIFHTLSDKTMSDKIFDGQNFSSDKIFVTSEKFRHFCPTNNFVRRNILSFLDFLANTPRLKQEGYPIIYT